jgi:hypothetical protein
MPDSARTTSVPAQTPYLPKDLQAARFEAGYCAGTVATLRRGQCLPLLQPFRHKTAVGFMTLR